MKPSSKILLSLLSLNFFLVLAFACMIRVYDVDHEAHDAHHERNAGLVISSAQEGSLIAKEFDLKDFDQIETRGLWSIEVTHAPQTAIKISGPERVFSHITVEKEGSTLVLDYDDDEIDDEDSPKAIISVPRLSAVELKGATHFVFSGFTTDKFKAELKGATSLKGMGNQIEHLALDAKGASSISLHESKIKNAEIDLSGASSLDITMNGGKLTGKIRGASSVTYRGEVALFNISESGFSRVSRD
jgi:hypothetical protein